MDPAKNSKLKEAKQEACYSLPGAASRVVIHG